METSKTFALSLFERSSFGMYFSVSATESGSVVTIATSITELHAVPTADSLTSAKVAITSRTTLCISSLMPSIVKSTRTALVAQHKHLENLISNLTLFSEIGIMWNLDETHIRPQNQNVDKDFEKCYMIHFEKSLIKTMSCKFHSSVHFLCRFCIFFPHTLKRLVSVVTLLIVKI